MSNLDLYLSYAALIATVLLGWNAHRKQHSIGKCEKHASEMKYEENRKGMMSFVEELRETARFQDIGAIFLVAVLTISSIVAHLIE